ncbi:porin family protein [Shewanella sp. MBTL60-007]|uniref:porin family protein n=1 Tax=Shewanella sp. MBTL60-007 TaxID=2815911 RepID=UPI001BC1FAEF|nr:porin family protein [Shewanella sp. MBTL60-007]GIU28686.1 membrane protein [Shewanella sp. MBTL60-007]
MRIFTMLFVGLLSCNAVAAESPHILGGSVGYGFQDLEKSESHSSSGGDNFVADIYYRYMWHDNLGMEAGYFAGSGGVASIFTGIISSISNIEYSGYRAALYGEYMLSASNRLYAKVGASANELSYDVGRWGSDEVSHIETNGTDIYAAIGWGLRFNSGVGINIEYQYVPVQTLEVQNLNIGMSYRF